MKIELQNLTKKFPARGKKGGEVTAVNDFSFEIPDGELIALLGPSGCGKSTTLNMICGLEKPTGGRIFFGNEDVTALPPELRGVGMVFQNYALYPHLTVRQNILFPLENLKGKDRPSKDEMNRRVTETARLAVAYARDVLKLHKLMLRVFADNIGAVKSYEKAGFVPSCGYFLRNGLADAVRRLSRDIGFGAKIYLDRIPIADKAFEMAEEIGMDPLAAALNGGDDFRYLFVVPIARHDVLRHDFQTFDIIGHLARPEAGAVIVTPEGAELPLKAQGW